MITLSVMAGTVIMLLSFRIIPEKRRNDVIDIFLFGLTRLFSLISTVLTSYSCELDNAGWTMIEPPIPERYKDYAPAISGLTQVIVIYTCIQSRTRTEAIDNLRKMIEKTEQ